jgi:hypothetical protein
MTAEETRHWFKIVWIKRSRLQSLEWLRPTYKALVWDYELQRYIRVNGLTDSKEFVKDITDVIKDARRRAKRPSEMDRAAKALEEEIIRP